ncbi:MAG: primosomal protein N' [Candidatus Marinimicrobia bacterium]|nr:primosomal protein N' [Candidatus Neomarinimicrobiota bacterium]MBT3631196.1 primosomal protein N' [Candidatus Neomarinimicrobiota bacterium]MBT3824704.1 primosomal protein N' [Candidatus Neomarinimicrobiota bacterium]MBT4131628.1 primosomal protein N' [Candidatus Neomarinimicrobiota bacterium]MBT4296097.1 primosomal protein N' [Candidatus Neomarinimicrobiota bacterium]
MEKSVYVEIVFPLSLDQAFTYSVPEELNDVVQIGQRVIASLGRRKQQGMIIGVKQDPPADFTGKLKSFENIVDPVPVFDLHLINLLKWMSRYYFTPLGKVIQSAIPSDARMKKEVIIQPTALLHGTDEFTRFLKTKGLVRLSMLKRKFGADTAVNLIARLQRQGLLELENEFGFKGKRASSYLVIPDLGRDSEIPTNARAQQKAFDILNDFPDGIQMDKLRDDYEVYRPIIHKLADRGLVTLQEIEPDIDPLKDYHRPPPKTVELNHEQSIALNEVTRSLDAHTFTPYLLFGVAGSGKTEVYLNAAAHTLAQGRSVIVLVPEIALAPQIAYRFQSRFGNVVALWHSGLKGAERLWTWQQIQKNNFTIVVGARSAVLTPLKDLGLIIVDEEQENSYKQQDNEPRYHARDVALMRGKEEKAVVLLGSATPSLETYYNLTTSRYKGLHLTKRWEKAKPPLVDLVDMGVEREETRDYASPFSRKLTSAIRETLDNDKQVILFQNRRGYAPVITCKDCNWTMTCPHDDISLTYHKIGNKMRCHFCDFEAPTPASCPECRSLYLKFGGMGTQMVEEALEAQFPDVPVCRMDMDTTRGKGAHTKLLGDFARGDYKILLGTQMIAKGLDFENVTLVGVINADSGLHFPDFRSREKTFQLVYQVSGRSGRGEFPGRVVVQSWMPEDISIQCATKSDVKLFYNGELNDRDQLQYPPFSRMISFGFQGRSRDAVIRLAERASEAFKKQKVVQLLGPAPAMIEKSHMGFHWKLVLKTSKAEDPSGGVLRQAAGHVLQSTQDKYVRVTVDVDPYQIL